ncbi:sugar ABC transporter ATP-binding protein [Microbacterium sp.]|uniref:sugar ABC transporter ATP-binding protein n=1 Tax=Microbacterium sp. TaxID=51671 RepID=UPI003A93060C
MSSTGSRLEVRDISKSYGAVKALAGVSFDVAPGEVHALLGHNGAGKSTLVKVLSGLVQPDGGEVLINGQLVDPRSPRQAQANGVALVDQELSLVPTLSVRENLTLGATRGYVPHASVLREILDSLGLSRVELKDQVGSLPLGEQQLIEIARALSRDAQILILDEPTATLSEHEIEMVFRAVRRMAADGRSIIYVSHRLGEILELCQRATVFRDGKCVGTEEVSNLSRESIVHMMLGHLPEVDTQARGTVSEGVVVEIQDLAVEPRLVDFDLKIAPGEIVGLAGQVGCGASDVLRALGGLVPYVGGTVSIDNKQLKLGNPLRSARAGILYTTSDRKIDGLFLGHSIARNLVATRLPRVSGAGFLNSLKERRSIRRLLELTGIAPDRRRTPVGALSGGNQQKVLVARSLDKEGCRLLVLDEPTRGVDVGGRADIHDLVRSAADEGSAVLFSSTELDEVLELSDTVVTMFGGRVVAVYSRADVSAAQVLTDMTHGMQEHAA